MAVTNPRPTAPVEVQLQEMIARQLGVAVAEIHASARLAEDLGANSLDLVELVLAMEERFEIEIPDEDAVRLETVADAIRYLEEHRPLPPPGEGATRPFPRRAPSGPAAAPCPRRRSGGGGSAWY
jgi:acyl carrier protein